MRKFSGIVMVIALIMGMYVPVSAQEKADSDFDMMLSVLSEIDVIEQDEDHPFDKTAPMSRAKFSEYVGKAILVSPGFSMQYFKDVSREHEQAEYINVLADCGIISLNDIGIFEPDRTIKYSEACKMLLCAMGYGDYARYIGTPMENWVSVAASADIDISVANADSITCEEAVRLIFNAMSKPLMIENLGTNEKYLDKETNLFAKYHNVYFDKGTVQATCGGYLEGFAMMQENMAVVSGKEFGTKKDLTEFLGTYVDYAYRWDKSEDFGEVFYAKVRNEDDVLEFSADLLVRFDRTSNTFHYLTSKDASRTKSQRIAKDFQLVYNGVPYEGTVESAVSGFLDGTRRGSVKLSDADRDGNFDVVIIKNYEIFPSGTIDTMNENLYGGFEKDTINYSEYDIVNVYNSEGEKEEISDVSNVVFNVARSVNKEFLEIIISNKSETISVTSVNKSENEIQSADGTTYVVDSRIIDEYSSVLKSYKSVKVYFDMFGYIVDIEVGSTSDFLVGYLVKGKSGEDDSGDISSVFTVYTRDGKLEKFNLAETVRIDGVSYKPAKETEKTFRAIPGVSVSVVNGNEIFKLSPQIIRYKLNDDREITALDTSYFTEGREDKANSLTVRQKGAPLLNSNRLGLDTYWSTSATVVFKIPTLNEEGKMYKNGEWADVEAKDFGTSVALTFDNTYTCDTYNFSDTDHYVDILVVVQDQKTKEANVLVFTGTEQVWDENEGEALTAVKCMRGGSEVVYKLSKGVEEQIDKLGVVFGDLLYISLDGSGAYGVEIKKIFDSEEFKFNNSGNPYWYYGTYSPYSNWSYRTGEDQHNNLSKMYVLKKRSEAVFGSYEKSGLADGVYEEVMRIGSIPVVVIDKENEEVEKGSFNSILSYEEAGDDASLILVESLTQVAKSVIVYR